MSYQLYRSTTLGIALRSTLDEFVEVCFHLVDVFDYCIDVSSFFSNV